MNITASSLATVPLLATRVVEKNQANDAQALTPTAAPAVAPAEGVKVSLSGEGMKKSSDEKNANPNADIESSGLPDQTQKLLKMIREIQKRIEDKQIEMQDVMADPSLSTEARQTRMGALQSELATLTANLVSANHTLDKQSRKLSPQQVQQAKTLAMKK